MSNTWGIGGEKFKTRKVKDYDHNERLHREAVERKAERDAQHKIEAAARSAAAAAMNLQSHLDAEDRRATRIANAKTRREAKKLKFEWGGKKYDRGVDRDWSLYPDLTRDDS